MSPSDAKREKPEGPALPPYYDHDPIWQQRADAKNPVWGSNSRRVYGELIELLGRHCPPPARVVDLGAGAGSFGEDLSRHGYAYVGIDASAVAIELGRRTFPSLDLRCADLVLPLEAQLGGFDVVTSVNALHCLVGADERRQFLLNARALCSDGGHFILTTMCQPLEPGFRQSGRPRAYLDAEVIKAELAAVGFSRLIDTLHILPNDRNKIGNLTVVAQPD